jgi:hypothetical protein
MAGLALGVSSTAQARTETLKWWHGAPPAASGFRVYVASSSCDTAQMGDVAQIRYDGLPSTNALGHFSFDLEVGDSETVCVAVSAYNSAGESSLSNEQTRDPAVFTQDFEASALGQQLPGWVDTQAWSITDEDDSLFSVTTLSGNRVFMTSSGQTAIHSHYAGSGSADWFFYEYRGRMRVSSSGGRLGVTAYSQFPSTLVYYSLGSHWETGELELSRRPAPDDTFVCGPSGTGVIPRPNVWYQFRFRVIPEDGANQLRAKVWEAGSTEPMEWQAACTDAAENRPSSGAIGVWSGSTGSKYWDDLEVIALPGGMVPSGPSQLLGQPGQPTLVLP